jgi:hypothetical protein
MRPVSAVLSTLALSSDFTYTNPNDQLRLCVVSTLWQLGILVLAWWVGHQQLKDVGSLAWVVKVRI